MRQSLQVRKLKRELKLEFPNSIVSTTAMDVNEREEFEINVKNIGRKSLKKVFKILYSENELKIIESNSPSISYIAPGKAEGYSRLKINEDTFEDVSSLYV